MLKYSEYYVNKHLSPFIKKLWTLDNSADPEEVPEKSVLPNGCFTIVFISGQGVRAETCRQSIFLAPGVYFCGQLTRAIRIHIQPYTKALMVQLFAWTPVHFTDSDMHLFQDCIGPFWEKGLDDYEQTLTNQQIAHAVYHTFKDRFRPNADSALIARSCALLIESCGSLPVREVCTLLGCSARHLQKKFKNHVGMSAKEFAVILKLRNAVDAIAYPEEDSVQLTHLALANNFYDQAHFNHTFKTIVHTSPGRFSTPDYLLAYKNN